jgi:nitrate/nitrite-specific signal transduction histidine kinase
VLSIARRRRSLRPQIIAWSLIPTMIILGAVALFAFYTYWQVTQSLVMERNQEVTHLLARQIGVEMMGYADTLDEFSRSRDVMGLDPTYQQTALRGAMPRLLPFDAGVVILDQAGRVVAADPRRMDALGQDWSDRHCYRLASSVPMYPIFGTDIETIGPNGSDAFAIIMPIRDDKMRFAGTIIGMFQLGSEQPRAFVRSLLSSHARPNTTLYMVDSRGRAIDHQRPERSGQDLSAQPAVQAVLSRQAGALRTRNVDNQEIIASFAPIENTTWGLIEEESWASLTQVSTRYGRLLLGLLVLGLLVPPIVVSIGIRRITRPIAELTDAAQKMAHGNLQQVIHEPQGKELAQLASAFNRMSSQLQELYANLEQRVQERTEELSTLNAIANVVSRSLNLEEVLQAALEKTLEVTGLEAGTAYRLDAEQETLTLMAHHGLSPAFVQSAATVALRDSAAGNAALQGAPVVRHASEYPPGYLRELLQQEGLQMALSIPLISRGKVLGALNLGSRTIRPFPQEEMGFLAAIGQQVGVAVENAGLYEQAEQVAIAAERNRLARELHDSVTQTLFSANLIAGVVPLLWAQDPADGLARLQELQELTRGALAEMRTLLLELRPEALAGAQLGDLLRQLAEATTGRARIPVTLTLRGQPNLPPAVKLAFYRIAQEALNNMSKYSGALEAAVILRVHPAEPVQRQTGSRALQARKAEPEGEQPAEGQAVELIVRDDGCGFDPAAVSPEHLGLRIMRERAQAIGASLRIESQPGQGTRISALWRSTTKTA